MSFKKNRYQIVRNAIPIDVATFLFDYLRLKRQVNHTLKTSTYISRFNDEFGKEGRLGQGDEQCPKAYSHYSDIAMETVLQIMSDKLSKITKLNLSPNYSYTRIYGKGDTLEKHIDRYSCEVSTTVNLGGDMWPIYLKDKKGKEIEVKLNPSDMLVYSGCELEHWRNIFEGDECIQVFLHYNDTSNKEWEDNRYDKRPHLGLPTWFKGKKLI